MDERRRDLTSISGEAGAIGLARSLFPRLSSQNAPASPPSRGIFPSTMGGKGSKAGPSDFPPAFLQDYEIGQELGEGQPE